MSIPVMVNEKYLNKLQLENLIKKKDQSLSFVKPSGAKSSYWDKFQAILVNNVRQKFIICNDCHSVLGWIASDGTNVMKKKHLLWHLVNFVFIKRKFFTALFKCAYLIHVHLTSLMEVVLKNLPNKYLMLVNILGK